MSIVSQDLKVGMSDAEKLAQKNEVATATMETLVSGNVVIHEGTAQEETTNFTDKIDECNEAIASIAHKANIDGYYSSMSVGLSDNFNTNMTIEDKSPYNFRTSGGALEIANQCKLKSITGGSVVFNQLVQNLKATFTIGGVTFTNNGDGTMTLNGTASEEIGTVALGVELTTNVTFPRRNHKVLVTCNNALNGFQFGVSGYSINKNDTFFFNESNNTDWSNSISCHIVEGTVFNNFKITPQVFDLTQKFGSTIADYIYSLEIGQAGVGVAWFRKYFSNDYYAYNPGSFLNVKTSGKKITHFNQWDGTTYPTNVSFENETIKNIYVDSRTSLSIVIQVVSSNGNVVRNISYSSSTSGNRTLILFYSGNIKEDEFISFKHNGSTQDIRLIRFTNIIPNTTYCLSFEIVSNHPDVVGGLVLKEPCINLHWDGERDGEYEPYLSTTYPIEDVELRGIPKLDSNNELYFDGDVYNSDGSVEVRYTLIKAKNLGWNYYNNVFYVNVSDIAKKNMDENSNILSNSYVTMNAGYSSSGVNKTIWKEQGSSSNTIYIRDDTYTDATTFINHFTDDDYILYEKATPSTTTATPFTELEAVDNWGTEEFLDNRDVPMPVGHITEYLPDLKAKLETAPESPEDDGYYIMKRDNGENSYSLLSTYLSANGYVVPTSISGYDATKTQVLKNVEGVLTWVDEEV